MHPLALRRCRAHLTDCVGYLGIAAAMIPAGILVVTTTDLGRSPLFAHLVSTVPPVIATVVAARAEAGPHRATWGKRREGLEVLGRDGEAMSLGEALGRNSLKILVPWQLGHLTAIGAAWGGFEQRDPLTLSSTIAVYTILGVYAWRGLRGSGRGVHDLLSGSHVAVATAARA